LGVFRQYMYQIISLLPNHIQIFVPVKFPHVIYVQATEKFDTFYTRFKRRAKNLKSTNKNTFKQLFYELVRIDF